MKSEKPLIRQYSPLLITLAVLVMAVAILTPSIAYYIINTNNTDSDYIPAESDDPYFYLDDENNEMSNVGIVVEDNGYPVYVRVAIVITWQKPDQPDGEKDVYFVSPVKDVDYTMDINTDDWTLLGGYYYCTSPVASGGTTQVLINNCALLQGNADLPEGYVLSVEVIVQTVQAIGATDDGDIPAWQDAWKNGPQSWK